MNDIFGFSIISAALVLSGMGLWFASVMPGLDRWSKRFFLDYFIVFMLCCLSGLGEMVLWYHPAPNAVVYFVLVLESLILSLPLPMLTVYLLHCCGETIRASKLLHAVLGLWAFYVVLLVSSPVIGGFAYITSDSLYQRGPLYPLLLLPLVVLLLVNLAGVIRRRAKLSHRVFLSILITVLPMTLALLVHMFIDVFPLIDVSYVLSALVMYGLILSDQIEQYRRQQWEIAHERASVMVLQMRPHFIYNTLMSIHSLCTLDSRKAQQITMDFTNYLRRNFNAVASDSAIPFSMELEHTRTYLAVEHAQFDDMLVVEYDTPFTNFRLPPLTLQPLVENAVKHGMDPDFEPLHVSIRTRRTDAGAEITVEDTGPGSDPTDEGKPHTTLDNIRQRLEMMCGGTMEIEQRDEGGTRVTIFVPLKKG